MRRRDEELELSDEELEEDEDLDDEDDEELEDEGSYEVMMGLRGFTAGLIVGAVLGAGVAILMAPERGQVIRRRLGRGLRELQDEALDHLDDWRGEARRELTRQQRRLKRRLRRARR